MLRTDLLTFAAFDTVAGFTAVLSVDVVVVIVGIPVLELFFRIQAGK